MTDEILYTKGFNTGYFLSEHEPALLKTVLTAQGESDYIKGLNDGKFQYERDKVLSQLKSHSKTKDQSKERER